MKHKKRISVIGLGKLGASYSAFFADAGFTVIGTDVNAASVRAVMKGKPPVVEPELAEYMSRNRERLSATFRTEDAVKATDITFVIVPTPSKQDGAFSLEYILNACTDIGAGMREKDSYHLISIVSTVLPGDSRNHIIPALEKSSGKRCGVDFGFCYNPSLIAIGEIFRNLEKPDFLFLGAFDERSEQTLADVFKVRYPKIAPERMSIESAEVAKIALNSYVTMKITFANTLAQMCERIPHADVRSVTEALGKDSRIGSKYLRSGLGYGGPCFPRDNAAFAQSASRFGVSTPIAETVHRVNTELPQSFVNLLKKEMRTASSKRIGFLGVSYKPRTAMLEESQALKIADVMSKSYDVHLYEPLGTNEAKKVLGNRVTYVKNLAALVKSSDLIFVSNNDAQFASLPTLVNAKKTPTIVVDPWNMYAASEFNSHVRYRVPGRK